MEKSFSELLHEAKLTKTGKIIADYILDHMIIACFLTSTELAAKLDVSEASIIRFSRSIGFKGYIDFQKYLQRIHLNTLTKISGDVESSSVRFAESMKEYPGELHFGIEAMKIAQQNLRNLFRLNGADKYTEIIKALAASDHIYLASSRSSYPFENRLWGLLSQITPNIIKTGGANTTVLERMTNISNNDTLIIFHLPSYTKLNYATMEMAHDSGAKIVCIAAVHNKDIPEFVDYTLSVDIGSNSFFPSMVSITFLIELLANGLSRELNDSAKFRLEKADYYMNKYKLADETVV